MESNFVKAAIGFGLLMVAGFLIVGTTRESQQEKIQGAFLQTSSMLSSLALEKCTEAVRGELGTQPYTPSESNSDNMTYVSLVWNNVGSAKRAECRYIINQGITLLKVDDRTVIDKEVATTGAAAPSGSPHHRQ